MAEVMHDLSSQGIGGTYVGRLPTELRELVLNKAENLMTRKEAEEIRLALMEERSRFVNKYNTELMEAEFNMCEH